MDTTSTLDSVLTTFLNRSDVVEGLANEQGIFVEYDNGIIGGILLDPLEDADSLGIDLSSAARNAPDAPANRSPVREIMPNHKKVALINVHYDERWPLTDQLEAHYSDWFPQVGYNDLDFIYGDQATLDVFKSLDQYGVIHIYSHGAAWRDRDTDEIREVYLMTGQEFSCDLYRNNRTLFRCGEVPVLKVHRGKNIVFVSPAFITQTNNFSADTTLVYGGFCYSYLGSWPETLHNGGVDGYFGISWATSTRWNARWANRMFMDLTDTRYDPPLTAEKWFAETDFPLIYWHERREQFVTLLYRGSNTDSLKLWEPPRDFNWGKVIVNVDGAFNNYGTYFTKDVDQISISNGCNVTYQNGKYRGTWDENTGYYDHVGGLEISFNPATNEVDSFRVWDSQFFGDWGTRTYEVIGREAGLPYNERLQQYIVTGEGVDSYITYMSFEETQEADSRTMTHIITHPACNIAVELKEK